MKNITPFTLLYAVLGGFLTVIALRQSDIAPNLRAEVWMFAGITYLVALLSTFPFWQQGMLNRQERIDLLPRWQQTSFKLAGYIAFAIVLVSPLANVLTEGWTAKTTVMMYTRLPFVVFGVEQFWIRKHILRIKP